MKKIKCERGSLALFVSIAMLFFMGFLMALYISTTTEQKTQLAITSRIKEIYEEDLDNIEEIYNDLVGTDEYIPIYTKEQLEKIGSEENVYISEVKKYYKFSLDSNYVLKNNIELNKDKYIEEAGELIFLADAEKWIPIGTSETNAFNGIFNGNGYKISGIYIDDSSLDYQGLFAYLGENGEVKDVIISGNITGKNYVGGIAGWSKGNINNCMNDVKITGSQVIGGIVGKNENKIENCTNNMAITGTEQIGGIAGNCDISANTKVTKCYNTAKISGTNKIGGIVGNVSQTNTTTKVIVELCSNKGEIEASNSNAGGIIGFSEGIVENCYNTATIRGNSNIGGIAGSIINNNTTGNPVGKIINCYSTGNIIGTTENTYGGIVGIINNIDCEIKNSYYLAGKASSGYNGDCNTCEIEEKSSEMFKSSNLVDLLNETQTKDNWKLVKNKNDNYPMLSWESGTKYQNYIEENNE